MAIVLLVLSLMGTGYAQQKAVKIKTKVIAHRGAWKNTGLPQNSLGALEAAVAMNCYASECDIWMTLDSVLVVNHDPHFFDMPIESTTYGQLLGKKYPNGEAIATLEQVLEVITRQKQTRLVLDIKPSKISKARSILTAEKAYEMVVADRRARKLVDYILFDYDACLALEERDPRANIAYLNGDKSPEEVAADGLWGIDYSYRVFQKNDGWVADALRRKLTVNVWTVNEQALAESYIRQGVNFITTDEPEMLLKMVSGH